MARKISQPGGAAPLAPMENHQPETAGVGVRANLPQAWTEVGAATGWAVLSYSAWVIRRGQSMLTLAVLDCP